MRLGLSVRTCRFVTSIWFHGQTHWLKFRTFSTYDPSKSSRGCKRYICQEEFARQCSGTFRFHRITTTWFVATPLELFADEFVKVMRWRIVLTWYLDERAFEFYCISEYFDGKSCLSVLLYANTPKISFNRMLALAFTQSVAWLGPVVSYFRSTSITVYQIDDLGLHSNMCWNTTIFRLFSGSFGDNRLIGFYHSATQEKGIFNFSRLIPLIIVYWCHTKTNN